MKKTPRRIRSPEELQKIKNITLQQATDPGEQEKKDRKTEDKSSSKETGEED